MPNTKRTPQDERSATTRAKLIEGAYRMLRDKGHASFRLADISTNTGVSRGGLLHHYPSKDDLVGAVYEHILEGMEEDTRNFLDTVPDSRLLSGLVEAAKKRFFDDSYHVILDILAASGEDSPVRKVQRAYCRPGNRTARTEWAERIADTGLDFKDADIVTQFLWGLVKGAAIRALVRKDQHLSDRVTAAALKLAEEYCRELREAAPRRTGAGKRPEIAGGADF